MGRSKPNVREINGERRKLRIKNIAISEKANQRLSNENLFI